MALDEQTELTADEIDEFLGRHETGVLSLAQDSEPYAVPISFGYDVRDRRFYLRLVSTPESEKRRFLDSRPQCRLVVYEEGDAIYQSVIARGELEAIETDELTVEHVEQYGRAKRPLFEIWGETTADLDVKLYQLAPEELSGRCIEISEDEE